MTECVSQMQCFTALQRFRKLLTFDLTLLDFKSIIFKQKIKKKIFIYILMYIAVINIDGMVSTNDTFYSQHWWFNILNIKNRFLNSPVATFFFRSRKNAIASIDIRVFMFCESVHILREAYQDFQEGFDISSRVSSANNFRVIIVTGIEIHLLSKQVDRKHPSLWCTLRVHLWNTVFVGRRSVVTCQIGKFVKSMERKRHVPRHR